MSATSMRRGTPTSSALPLPTSAIIASSTRMLAGSRPKLQTTRASARQVYGLCHWRHPLRQLPGHDPYRGNGGEPLPDHDVQVPILAMERIGPRLDSGVIRHAAVALGMILGVNVLGALPAFFIGSETGWVERPWFYPPEIVFPVVWTTLFTLMGVALYLVWRQGTHDRAVRIAFLAFFGQFLLNIAWTPAFFGLRRPGLGLLVIVLLWFAIVGTIVTFKRVSRPAAVLLAPYLLWVTFAAVLNGAIFLAMA